MSNPSQWFALAGISMSFVGFSSLFMAFRRREAGWELHDVGRLTGIVLWGLLTVFGALLVVPIASLIGASSGLRVMSAALLAVGLYMHQVRVGTSWLRWQKLQTFSSRRDQVIDIAPFATAALAEQALLLANVFAAREDLYELALMLMLVTPALVFVLVVTDLLSSARQSRVSP